MIALLLSGSSLLATPEAAPSAMEPMPLVSAYLAAPAEDKPQMEYTYIEANYISTDSDDLDQTLDGWEATGSLELPLNFFLQATVNHLSDSADLDTYRIGAGYHLPVGSNIDAYGILFFAHEEVDGSGADFSEDGMAAEVGVRFLITPKFEVNGNVEWVDVEDSNAGGGIGARFYVINRLSLGGRVENINGDTTFLLGARFEL